MASGADRLQQSVQQAALAAWMHIRLQPISMRVLVWVLLLGAAALQWGARPWVQQQVADTAKALEERAKTPLARGRASSTSNPQDQSESSADEVSASQRIWNGLPAASTFGSDLDVLVATSRKMNLNLVRAQMRRADAPLPLVMEEVDLELEVPYPVVRRFVARALNELPHASVRRIRLERAAGVGATEPGQARTDSGVRATITLRLHYRHQGRAS